MSKTISVFTTCFNEEENVEELYSNIKKQLEELKITKGYNYEHVFIDNASTDRTVPILKEIAAKDSSVKIIVNAKNAGWSRSFQYGITQIYADAVIFIEADQQTPPDVIPRFVEKWEEGYKVIAGVKESSTENKVMFLIRRIFYKILNKFSDVGIIENFLGVGLYDQTFIERIRHINDQNPFFRGLVVELGSDVTTVEYKQLKRKKGKTHFNFYQMYDLAMLGFTSYTKIPLRIASFTGYICAFASIIVAIITFIQKIINWDTFAVGTAAITIGLFFFASVQLVFLGLLGEYISEILTQVKKRPLVIERERVNM